MSPAPPFAGSLILLAKYRENPAKSHSFGNNPGKSTVPFLIQFINATTGGFVNLHVSKVRLIFTPSLSSSPDPFFIKKAGSGSALKWENRIQIRYKVKSWIWIRSKVTSWIRIQSAIK
jgi:hypothetical protein